jgi:hypothetical protein
MTLRPEYSLGHSEYNAFLFAAVGEEKVGLPLTVLTALTRLGFDPWREAARLSDLPRETAARAFAVTIAMLPEGDWKASESEAIATRLVKLAAGAEHPGHPFGESPTHRRQEDEVAVCDSAVLGRACRRPALSRAASLGR